jgi:arsenate reductase-like glutaredoxin family protein
MRVWGLRNCDVTRGAIRALTAASHAPMLIDVREDGIAEADLAAMFAAFGARTINAASPTLKGLPPEVRALPGPAIVRAAPAVLKRPVIEHEGRWLHGWTPATKAALGL